MSRTTLTIMDEVNIRFSDLDSGTRRKLSKAVEYEIPGGRFTPAARLGRWNPVMSYCDISGKSFLNLLDKLVPIVQAAGYEIDIADQRIPIKLDFEKVSNTSYEHVIWPEGHQLAGKPIFIKDHQVKIINACLENPQGVGIVPTGGGKTIITAILSHKCEQYGRTVLIVPSKDLVTQTEEDYRNFGLDVGVYFGDRKEYGHTHTICTWQSLDVLLKNSLTKNPDVTISDFIDGVKCVIVDECFREDARVLTNTGYKRIADVSVGDRVVNYSTSTKTFKEDVVVDVYRNLTKSTTESMFELEFDTGSTICVTGNHKFLTDRGWVRADQLTEHDIIVSIHYKEKRQNRSKEKIVEDINKKLAEYNQELRVVSITGMKKTGTRSMLLSNNTTLSDKEVYTLISRMCHGNEFWYTNFDNIYRDMNTDVIMEYRKAMSYIGGKNCWGKHGTKIRLNLNQGTPWNKSTVGLQPSPWCKGLTKETDARIAKLSNERKGSGNPMYNTHMSEEAKLAKSNLMKDKILSGEFTTKSNNRFTHWDSYYCGIKFRSSWEAIYYSKNTSDLYEDLRIPYMYMGKRHIYIVDFVNHDNKTVSEVKPAELLSDTKIVAKICALRQWCTDNGYQLNIVTQVEIKMLVLSGLELDKFDKKTVEKINNYETR